MRSRAGTTAGTHRFLSPLSTNMAICSSSRRNASRPAREMRARQRLAPDEICAQIALGRPKDPFQLRKILDFGIGEVGHDSEDADARG